NALEKTLPKYRIVLCNPPFEDFNEHERNQYGNRLQSVHKPYEILRRVLDIPPAMMGFVLPKSAIIGGRYDDLQSRIAGHYTNIETVALPDRVFAFSDQETMLVMASRLDPEKDISVFTKTTWVREKDRQPFLEAGHLPESIKKTTSREVIQKAHKDLWNPPLWEVFEYLSEYLPLKDIADVHRGIEWNIPLDENRNILISDKSKPKFMKGIDKVPGKLEQYWAQNFVYLNMDDRFRRTRAHFHPWRKPKVIINGHVLRRGPWRMAGFPDNEGLVCNQNLIGIWPTSHYGVEVIASLINSPVINSILFIKEGKWRNRVQTIKACPTPFVPEVSQKRITQLVREYQNLRKIYQSDYDRESVVKECEEKLRKIDSIVLESYDLPPRFERKLLDFFKGYSRPVAFPFPDYFPADFKPCIPLYQYLEMDMKKVSAGELLKRIEPIDSEVIHEFVRDLEEMQA
ncbi:MAG: hypothetical protein KJ935_07370, partial [Candidatus Omnitrophica bacterium]|nr:hypothetical protein [Candidatus Omnitrophota bacterium]